MIEIKYIDGDVREPIDLSFSGALIAHCVNDQRKMGSGVAKSLFDKWPQVRSKYIGFCSCQLGDVQYVDCEPLIVVANMVGQHMIGQDEDGNPPIRYDAFRSGFQNIVEYIRNKQKVGLQVKVHMPFKIGCDRAGGSWEIVEQIIKEELCEKDIEVIIYKWKG